MGPAAGVNGGHVIAEGTPAEIAANPKSLTGDYLSGRRRIDVPLLRRPMQTDRVVRVVGARGNNLKTLTAEFPLGTFTCVTGVSGGGKSTLVVDTLYKAAARRLMGAGEVPAPHDRIEGLELLDKIIDIDQSPIGRTPRSNPATYTDLFAPIRDWFAELPDSRARGYKPGRFSFNVKGGRCEACQGDGVLKIEMHFLPDVYVTCDTCKGRRYNRETLEIKFRDKSIAEVLAMTVDEAVPYFSAQQPHPRPAENPAAGRAGLYRARPAGDHAVRRRGATDKTVEGAGAAGHRAHAVHPRRADHRPAFRGRAQAAGGAARAGRSGQHRGGDRAQSGGDQDRRLDSRSRPRGRRRRRADRRRGHAGGRSRRIPRATPVGSSRRCCCAGRSRRCGAGRSSTPLPRCARERSRREAARVRGKPHGSSKRLAPHPALRADLSRVAGEVYLYSKPLEPVRYPLNPLQHLAPRRRTGARGKIDRHRID